MAELVTCPCGCYTLDGLLRASQSTLSQELEQFSRAQSLQVLQAFRVTCTRHMQSLIDADVSFPALLQTLEELWQSTQPGSRVKWQSKRDLLELCMDDFRFEHHQQPSWVQPHRCRVRTMPYTTMGVAWRGACGKSPCRPVTSSSSLLGLDVASILPCNAQLHLLALLLLVSGILLCSSYS